jgi:membrane protein YdbS with pleckstrin-like domain
MSRNPEKNEDREFQLQMLEVQRASETINSVFTVIMSISYSWSGTMYALTFAVSEPLKSILLVSAIVAVTTAIITSYLLYRFHRYSLPRKIQKIRKRFVEPYT